eukprot:761583-Hanusia_phi.AAC.7
MSRKKVRTYRPTCSLVQRSNWTSTSTRPGRISAGSSSSRWLVVMNRRRPSCAATPSMALRRPENVRPPDAFLVCLSRKAASTSSSSRIHRGAELLSSSANESSVSFELERETT